LRGLVQVVDLQLAQGTQLVGRELQVGPFGNVGRLIHQQLAFADNYLPAKSESANCRR